MLSTTLTNNRVINGAVVKYKTEGKILTLQIEGNHLIALDTYCKINITGLIVINDVNNNDIFNGIKIFEAVSNTILETTITLSVVYENINLQVISGTPVVTTANESWIINTTFFKKFNCKLINNAIENFNSALIEVFATKSNGLIGDSDFYSNGTNGDPKIYSIHEQNLTFINYQTATFKLYNSPNSLTNIPLIIEELR
jgi:hypothetical protein